MSFSIELSRQAQCSLNKIHPVQARRIIAAIQELAGTSRPPGCIKLTNQDVWRIRIGDYRVLYEIHDGRLVILVLAIAHRSEAYGR